MNEWNAFVIQTFRKEGGRCPVDGSILSHENIFPDNFTRREIMQCKAKVPTDDILLWLYNSTKLKSNSDLYTIRHEYFIYSIP